MDKIPLLEEKGLIFKQGSDSRVSYTIHNSDE